MTKQSKVALEVERSECDMAFLRELRNSNKQFELKFFTAVKLTSHYQTKLHGV